MATDVNSTSEQETPTTSGQGLFLPLIMLVAAATAGAAVPFLLPLVNETASVSQNELRNSDLSLNGERVAFVPFGEVTVNLDEGRMNRYLRLKLSLQIDVKDEEVIQQSLERQNLRLRNWLLSHLSDKTLEQIRGKAGQNMLRREIRNHFNTTLFPDGYDRIHDVLFEEFNVQ